MQAQRYFLKTRRWIEITWREVKSEKRLEFVIKPDSLYRLIQKTEKKERLKRMASKKRWKCRIILYLGRENTSQ